MMRHTLRWSKWIALTLLGLLLSVVLLLAVLLFTHSGLNLAVWGAQKAVPQLQIETSEGALLSGFSLDGVSYKDEAQAIDLQARHVALDLNASCLLDLAVCLNNVALEGVNFSMPQLPPADPNAPEEPASEPVTSLSAPIPLQLDRLALDDIHLDVLGNQVDWAHFSTAAIWTGDHLTLKPTRLEAAVVALAPADTETQDAVAAVNTPSEPQTITLPDVWIPLTIDVESIELQNFTLAQATPVEIHHLMLKASAQGDKVNVEQLDVDLPQASAELSTQIQLSQAYPLSLQADVLVKDPMAKGQTLTLSASGSAQNLTLHAVLDQVVKSQIDATLQPLEPTLPFNVAIKQTQAQWPLTGQGDYFVDLQQLQATGSLDGYQLNLALDAKGKEVPDTSVHLQGHGDLKQIDLSELLIETLGGAVHGQVAANWADLVNWKAALQIDNIQPGLQWAEAEGKIDGRVETSGSLTQQGGWQVDLPVLNIDGVLRGYPLNVVGSVTAADPQAQGEIRMETPGISLSHGPNHITAKGKLDQQWKMDVAIALPQLAKSIPDLAGQIQGKIAVRGEMAQPDLNLLLDVNKVQWQDQATLQNLHLQGDVTPLPQPKANLSLTVKEATYQDNRLDSLTLNVNGTQLKHNLTLDLDSNLAQISLALNGTLQDQPVIDWQGQLERAEITSVQGTWHLNQPTALGYNLGTQLASVQAHCWLQDESSLCLDKDIQVGESGEAQLTLNHFDFKQLKGAVPEETQVDGQVNAEVWAQWAPNQLPQAKVKLDIPQGKLTQQLDTPLVVGWDRVSVVANMVDNHLDANWLIAVTDNGQVSGDLAIPDLASEQKQMQGKLKLSTFNLDFLAPLFGEQSQVKSNIESDLTFSGPLLQPQVFGDLLIQDILVAGKISPVAVDSGQVVTTFNGDNATLKATIHTPDGDLNAKGDADWQDLAAWNTNLRIFANELKVDVPPMVKVKVTPDMTISVTPERAKINGDINLPWGRIDVQDLPPSAVSVSKDQILLTKDKQPLEQDKGVPFKVETNVAVHIGDDFRLSAFGLKGNLQGDLKVAQREDGAYVVGEVNILEGQYRSFGQDLLIKEGKILMNGPVDQPYVAITAIRNPDNTEDDVTAGVKVTGPADQPKVTIFSDPAMPQSNALSYLLRGQDIDAESDGNAMYTALIGLSLAQSGKVVGEIGEAFGVQDLQLDTQGAGDDSQVTVSGYILPGLQVKYGVGIFDSVGEFTVRYRLLKNLYVEAVNGLDNAVDLLYQFEFD